MSSTGIDAKILRALRDSPVHLGSGDLARALGVPSQIVEDRLQALVTGGFQMENRPGLGWGLLASPDRLIADDLLSRLSSGDFVREILVFESTDSTNNVAMKLGRDGHPGGVAVFAETQTAGRGRFGRRWESAGHAGIWMSLLVRPDGPPNLWPRMTTWAGVGISDALSRLVRKPVRLKWPNDVLIAHRKAAGVLIETAQDAGGRMFAVVGIGVNVNQAGFPPELQSVATSVAVEKGESIDRPALAASLLDCLAARWNELEQDFPALLNIARERSSVLGTWVKLASGNEGVEGLAEDLVEDGQLLLRLDDGSVRLMTAGEVTTRLT